MRDNYVDLQLSYVDMWDKYVDWHEQFSIKDKYMTILTQYQNPRSVKEGMPMRLAWLLCIIICCNNHYLFEAKLIVAYAYLCLLCACYYSIKYLDMQDKYMYVDIQDSYVNIQHMLTCKKFVIQWELWKISEKFQIWPKLDSQHAI